jgi:hypothetical protein
MPALERRDNGPTPAERSAGSTAVARLDREMSATIGAWAVAWNAAGRPPGMRMRGRNAAAVADWLLRKTLES